MVSEALWDFYRAPYSVLLQGISKAGRISIALVIHSFDPDLAKWVATVVAIGRSLLQELGFAVLNPTYKLRARVFHMIRFRKGGISDENYGYVNYSIGSAFGQQRCARVHALGFGCMIRRRLRRSICSPNIRERC